MSLFDRLLAAVKLAPTPTPKVPRKALSLPSFLRSAPNPANVLPREDARLGNTDVTTFRTEQDSRATIRKFVEASPDLSAAVFAYLRTGITDKYTAVARNIDGTFNPEATASLQSIIQRMDVLGDYSEGYSAGLSLRSASESLAKELVMYGSCCVELILDKSGMPKRLQPISVTQIEFKAEKDGTLKPLQKTSAGENDLDWPSVFYVALDQNLLQPYSSSPIESAIQAVLFAEEFTNDLRRVIKKVLHPRQQVVIDEEKLRRSIPSDIINDPEAIVGFYNTVISNIEQKLNGLRPEDALVFLDSIGVSLENNGNASLSDEWNFVKETAHARLTSGAKTPAAVMGFGAASSNIASTESLLFMKNANGVVTAKLNEIFSRCFTLAVRLMGYDVVVEFRYNPIDLRPETELEAFRAQKTSRILDLLSVGMLDDTEACLELTGKLPPTGYTLLSGTMFRHGGNKATDTTDPYGGASNKGSTLNKSLEPETPTNTRGGNKKASDEDAPELQATQQVITPNITVNTTVESQQTTKARVLKMRREENGTLVIEQQDEA